MQFLRSRLGALAAVGLVVVVAAVVAAIALTGSPATVVSPSPSASSAATPTPSPSPSASPVAVCPMNGTGVSDPALATRTPILVQIENNPIARPPSGLNLADL